MKNFEIDIDEYQIDSNSLYLLQQEERWSPKEICVKIFIVIILTEQ